MQPARLQSIAAAAAPSFYIPGLRSMHGDDAAAAPSSTAVLSQPLTGLAEDLAQCRDGTEGLCLLQTRPLHAHDEMVDAKQRVVALDLILHERFVADDEAILDEFLERLGEGLSALGLLVKTPGRISALLVFEGSLTFLEGLGLRDPDVALA